MNNALMCTLDMYNVNRITCHLHVKLKSFSKLTQPLLKQAVSGCSFFVYHRYKKVVMSEAFFLLTSVYMGGDSVFFLLFDDQIL